MSTTEALPAEFRRALIFRTALDELLRAVPADDYTPHSVCRRGPYAGMPSGQLQFHRSRHPFRIMAPGNGWGGTTAMGAEIDAWCRGTQRWRSTPRRPVVCAWFGPRRSQIEMVIEELRTTVLGRLPQWRTRRGVEFMEWPNGSRLYFGSYAGDWTGWQGIVLDLAAFDEQPPINLWREVRQRRRGMRKTELICKATQTEGWSWMADEIYKPWLEFHRERGCDEEGAHEQQLHPMTWLWARGGIHDNPGIDDQDIAEQEAHVWSSAKERKVRLYGGFESWFGDPVFDEEALEAMRMRAMLAAGCARTGQVVAWPMGT